MWHYELVISFEEFVQKNAEIISGVASKDAKEAATGVFTTKETLLGATPMDTRIFYSKHRNCFIENDKGIYCASLGAEGEW